MDTDDLELDGDDLLPPFRGSFHQQSYEGPRARPARTPVSRNHAEAPINADAAKSILSIPGPAGAPGSSEAMHQGISMEGSHTGVSDALGTIGPHSTVVSSFLVILEECLPHIDGGGCAVKLKVCSHCLDVNLHHSSRGMLRLISTRHSNQCEHMKKLL